MNNTITLPTMISVKQAWSSPNLYFGLLTMCPTCRRYEVNNNLWWWEWILPEVQEEYSRALNASTGERRNE